MINFTELPPKEVDGKLQDKWHLSLFRFAQILATCAGDWLQRPEMLNITKAKIKRQRELLLSLITYIFKRLKEIDSFTFLVDKNLSDEELIKEYELTAFFKRYFNPLMARLDAMEKAHKPRQGAHIVKRSILAASWGSLIYQHGQKMNWALLADLYEWFWERLCTIPYYRSIRIPKTYSKVLIGSLEWRITFGDNRVYGYQPKYRRTRRSSICVGMMLILITSSFSSS